MQQAEAQKRIDEIDKKISGGSLLETLGTVVLGVGLYAKFGVSRSDFLPLLNDQRIANALVSVGLGITLWGLWRIFVLIRERQRIKQRAGL